MLERTSPRFWPTCHVDQSSRVPVRCGTKYIYMHCYNWDVPLTMHEYIMLLLLVEQNINLSPLVPNIHSIKQGVELWLYSLLYKAKKTAAVNIALVYLHIENQKSVRIHAQIINESHLHEEKDRPRCHAKSSTTQHTFQSNAIVSALAKMM